MEKGAVEKGEVEKKKKGYHLAQKKKDFTL